MKKIITGYADLYCFARWSENLEFSFLGIGRVIDFKDNSIVFDEKGNQTFCLEFRISCENQNHKLHKIILMKVMKRAYPITVQKVQ